MSVTSNDSLLAAEYVLGVLPAPERVIFAERLLHEPELVQEVAAWEAQMSPLVADVLPSPPPARVWRGIERRLFEPAARSYWRWLGPAIAVALSVVALIGWMDRAPQGPLYVAEMTSDEGVRLAALYDADKGEMRVSMAGAPPREGRDFELWLIAGDGAPISLGVMPREGQAAMPIPAELRALVASATMAITDEPLGGSPTGVATGPLVAAAPMVRI